MNVNNMKGMDQCSIYTVSAMGLHMPYSVIRLSNTPLFAGK